MKGSVKYHCNGYILISIISISICFEGGQEEGFVPSDNDLQRIATQHGLGRPLPDYIPYEVRTVSSNWCRSHGVTVTVANAATVYQHLRQYVKDKIR